jgi:hypothetical protein
MKRKVSLDLNNLQNENDENEEDQDLSFFDIINKN